MLFLYPLMLQAYKGVPSSPWLRGSLDGITPGGDERPDVRRDRFRRGVFTHVLLHAKLESATATAPARSRASSSAPASTRS